jgi:hypothetical protein
VANGISVQGTHAAKSAKPESVLRSRAASKSRAREPCVPTSTRRSDGRERSMSSDDSRTSLVHARRSATATSRLARTCSGEDSVRCEHRASDRSSEPASSRELEWRASAPVHARNTWTRAIVAGFARDFRAAIRDVASTARIAPPFRATRARRELVRGCIDEPSDADAVPCRGRARFDRVGSCAAHSNAGAKWTAASAAHATSRLHLPISRSLQMEARAIA